MIGNTLLYCTLAAGIDVVLGTAIAYLLLRTRLPGRQWLDWGATAALAIPGIVLAIGFLRAFRGIELPFIGGALTASWIAIMLAYAVRRLPYAVRSCVAALQQVHVSLEEAAQSLGANRRRTARRIVIPLMMGGILAGFVTSFITAAVELSATILLATSESQAPLSYGIYLYNQSIATRGPAAALGVIAIVIVALGMYVSQRLLAGARRRREDHGGHRMSDGSLAEQRASASRSRASISPTAPTSCCATFRCRSRPASSSRCSGRRDRASRRCCACSPGSIAPTRDGCGSAASTSPRCRRGNATSAWCSRTTRCGRISPWRENVAFGLEERRWPRARIRARVREMLDLVSLAGYDDRRPGQLSGGQQQRVAIARTLAIEPRVLLLDEPLSNLDAKLRASTGLELKRLQRRLGITTVFVTHDQQEAMTIADRLAVLDQGVIQQVGTPRELYDAPVNRFVAEFVGSINLYRGARQGRRDRHVARSKSTALAASRCRLRVSPASRPAPAERWRSRFARTQCGSPARGRSRGSRSMPKSARRNSSASSSATSSLVGALRVVADLPHARFAEAPTPGARVRFVVAPGEILVLADPPR